MGRDINEKFNDLYEKIRKEDKNKEFNELYAKYSKEVEEFSGGLVNTNKADFLKMYSFYSAVVYPDINKHMDKLVKFMAKL